MKPPELWCSAINLLGKASFTKRTVTSLGFIILSQLSCFRFQQFASSADDFSFGYNGLMSWAKCQRDTLFVLTTADPIILSKQVICLPSLLLVFPERRQSDKKMVQDNLELKVALNSVLKEYFAGCGKPMDTFLALSYCVPNCKS